MVTLKKQFGISTNFKIQLLYDPTLPFLAICMKIETEGHIAV
jgi:hypothetical protein